MYQFPFCFFDETPWSVLLISIINSERVCFGLWLQRVRVHNRENSMTAGNRQQAWQPELAAESSHLNKEHEAERGEVKGRR